jgi:hypothetical protein
MYKILDWSYKRADDLGLEIKPSQKKNKKIDVYKNDEYITSIGNSNYMDYPTYILKNGKEYADKRRRLYYIRHKKDVSHFRGNLTAHILW